jgi:tetratricopeptide (TPR) repeat protein
MIFRSSSLIVAAFFCLHALGQTAVPGSGSAIPANPVPPPSLKSLQAAIDSGHASDALEQIKALEARGSRLPGLKRIEGSAYYALDSMEPAAAAYAAALSEDPRDAEAAGMRGLVLLKLGRPADAIPLLEQAGRAFSEGKSALGKADPNYALALCFIDTRRYEDARHAFAAQFGFAADGKEAYLVAARMLLRRDYLPVAKEFAEKAVALDATLPLAHELLGEVALAQGRLNDAITEFETERKQNPLEPSTYDRLGDAYFRAGRYDDAQRALQEALLLEPNSTGPFILLGKTLLRRADPAGAAKYLEHAAQMDNANYITHFLLGQAYHAMGRNEDAKRETDLGQKLQAGTEPKIENAR